MIPLLIATHAVYSQKRKADDVKTTAAFRQLYEAYVMSGQLEKARFLVDDHLKSLAALTSPRHGSLLEAELKFVDLLLISKEHKEAESRLMDILTREPALFDPISVEAADTHRRLAVIFARDFRFAESEHQRRSEYAIRLKVQGRSHGSTIFTLMELTRPLIELEKFDEAESVLRELIKNAEARRDSVASIGGYRIVLLRSEACRG